MKWIRISAVWCTSCILTYSAWEKLKKEYPDAVFEEYDYDIDHSIVDEYHIGNILPVILLFHQNKEVTRIVGEKSFQDIAKILEKEKREL